MAEDILHFAAVRLRLNGTGNLQMRLLGFDDVKTATLKPLTMSQTPGREVDRLANFKSQRARFEGKVTQLDENFKINRIILFVKPSDTQYPG